MAAVEAGVDAVDAAIELDVGPHLAALPRLAGRGARRHRPRHRAGCRGDPKDLVLFRGGARRLPRLRIRPPLRRVGGLSPRDAGRPVHQPQGAGPFARPRGALARGRPHLCRGQHALRRHRQGDAVVEGGGRPRADDGGRRHHRRRGGRPAEGDRLPRVGRPDDARRPRPAAGRVAGGAAEEGAQGPDADHRPSRFAASRRPISTPRRSAPRRRSATRRTTASSPHG